MKSTVYGYYTELPQSRIVLAPKRLNSLKNVDLKSQLFIIALFFLFLWHYHILRKNSMKLQHDDSFPDFANSKSFFHLKQRLFQKHENFQ